MEIGETVDQRIAGRLGTLRGERGWSLEELAERTGISRPTLSRIERGELSPTANMLGQLCAAFGWTLSRLIAEAEGQPASLLRAADQVEWEDPESRYVRRAISPPGAGLRAEMVEVRFPRGASVRFDSSPVPGLEHHLWMLEGTLDLTVRRHLSAASRRLSALRPEWAHAVRMRGEKARPLCDCHGAPVRNRAI
jgi:transcriptional regulator with XRE-family HTH domain